MITKVGRTGDCKLRIANCKLQNEVRQFAICNLQSAIKNSRLPLALSAAACLLWLLVAPAAAQLRAVKEIAPAAPAAGGSGNGATNDTFLAMAKDYIAMVTAPCPMMDLDEYGWFMGQQGLSPNLNGYAVHIFVEWNVGGAPGIQCGVETEAHLAQVGQGAPHGAIIEALVLSSSRTFNDVLALAEGAAIIGPGSPEIGGEIGGVCYSGDLAVCIAVWHRSGLVLSTALAGPVADVTQDRAVSLLSSMVETMVAGLAEHAEWTVPGAPTTIPAPTTAASPTIGI